MSGWNLKFGKRPCRHCGVDAVMRSEIWELMPSETDFLVHISGCILHRRCRDMRPGMRRKELLTFAEWDDDFVPDNVTEES